MDFRSFALAELHRIGRRYQPLKDNIAIVCPNPYHGGFKFKCYIHTGFKLPQGTVHCWVCGKAYHGYWNDILVRDLRVKPFNTEKINGDDHFSAANLLLNEIKQSNHDTSVQSYKCPIVEPWKGTWRKLPERFLIEHSAHLHYDRIRRKYWILFLFNYNGVYLGHTKVRLDQDIKKGGECLWVNDWDTAEISCPKYKTTKCKPICDSLQKRAVCSIGVKAITMPKSINSKNPFARKLLFPLNNLSDTAIIVEGLYDALRFRFLGFPALSNMGTETWSNYKISLLHGLGIKRIFIMFDGDDPGYDHARMIRRDIKKEFQTTLIDLPVGYDPGNLPESYLIAFSKLFNNRDYIPYLKL